ncbi:MAG: rhomboid family intramembrane serine protease [Pirellulaceae bacterium]|nr:rhomboid family intramembrane serine protease [Pirellulaceae bacterium]
MRKIGKFPDETAQYFVNYLVASEMPAQISPAPGGGFDLWIVEEDHLVQALQDFEEFTRNPDDPKYRQATTKADEFRQKQLDRVRQYQKNVQKVHRRTVRRKPPVGMALLFICIIAFVTSKFSFNLETATVQSMAFMFAPASAELDSMGSLERQCYNLMQGEVWRLITPAFLHMSFAHIIFNMYWLVRLGFHIEQREGIACFLSLVLTSAAIPNLLQATVPVEFGGTPAYSVAGYWVVPFGGFSGVGYAIFGFVWMRGTWKIVPEYFMSPVSVMIWIAWFMLGVVGLDRSLVGFQMADWAHGGGLFIGLLFGAMQIGRTAKQR